MSTATQRCVLALSPPPSAEHITIFIESAFSDGRTNPGSNLKGKHAGRCKDNMRKCITNLVIILKNSVVTLTHAQMPRAGRASTWRVIST